MWHIHSISISAERRLPTAHPVATGNIVFRFSGIVSFSLLEADTLGIADNHL
jgi:hypothetical protein